MKKVKEDSMLERVYPFVIYKDDEANTFGIQKEPIIHINTLAQMCYRVYSQKQMTYSPILIVIDKYAIEGVGENGLFEFDFECNFIKKVEDIDFHTTDIEAEHRLGIVHNTDKEDNDQSSMDYFRNVIQLHGDLKEVYKKETINLGERMVHWIGK